MTIRIENLRVEYTPWKSTGWVCASALGGKLSKLFDGLHVRCLTTAARKPSILVEQATSSYSFRSPELSQPI
jgi:hypothetical protein